MERYGHWKTTRHVCNTKSLSWGQALRNDRYCCIEKNSRNGADEYPEAAQVIKENMYMDDIIESVPTKEKATRLAKDIEALLDEGNFKRKNGFSPMIELICSKLYPTINPLLRKRY